MPPKGSKRSKTPNQSEHPEAPKKSRNSEASEVSGASSMPPKGSKRSKPKAFKYLISEALQDDLNGVASSAHDRVFRTAEILVKLRRGLSLTREQRTYIKNMKTFPDESRSQKLNKQKRAVYRWIYVPPKDIEEGNVTVNRKQCEVVKECYLLVDAEKYKHG